MDRAAAQLWLLPWLRSWMLFDCRIQVAREMLKFKGAADQIRQVDRDLACASANLELNFTTGQRQAVEFLNFLFLREVLISLQSYQKYYDEKTMTPSAMQCKSTSLPPTEYDLPAPARPPSELRHAL